MANEEDEDDESDTEAGWSAEDEEEFRKELDKDGDGFLNKDEIYHWLVPDDYDHITDESNHLFSEADTDNVSWFIPVYMFDSTLLFLCLFYIVHPVRCALAFLCLWWLVGHGQQWHYVYAYFTCACQRRHSPTGLPSTSAFFSFIVFNLCG